MCRLCSLFLGLFALTCVAHSATPLSQQYWDCKLAAESKNWVQAEAECKDALSIAQHLPQPSLRSTLELLRLLGVVYVNERKFEDAVATYQQRFQIIEKHSDNADTLLGVAAFDLAEANWEARHNDQADYMYRKAISVFDTRAQRDQHESQRKIDRRAVQKVYVEYASFLQQIGRSDEAAEAKKKADQLN